MESPKSRQHKEKRGSNVRRKHSNKKFYNSKAWRDTRANYLRHYQALRFRDIPNGKWKDQDLSLQQVTYLLSLTFEPCETCLRLYAAEAYDTVEPGKELDHIEPVNPENALDTKDAQYIDRPITKDEIEKVFGEPFEFNNLQFLCKRHHAKKSQRER